MNLIFDSFNTILNNISYNHADVLYMSKFVLSLFLLTRPVNVMISILSIFLAAFICGGLGKTSSILLACLAGAFITAGANTINDFYDLEIDHVNKPFRPLPSKMVSQKAALILSLLCFGIAMILGLFINLTALGIIILSSLLLCLYSARLKRTVLWGNLTVSFITGLAFIFGGVAVGHIKNALIPAAFALLLHFGREIIKDMEDITGDRLENAKTLPIVYGIRSAQWLTTVIFSALFVATIIPFVFKIYGKYYLLIVMLGVNTLVMYTVVDIWARPSTQTFRRISALLKADMLVGLTAIYVGRW